MITKIKDKLRDNTNLIDNILRDLNCTKISFSNDRFFFGRDEDSSGHANTIKVSTLVYDSYSMNIHGDIITLVSDIKNISIGESIKWLANKLHIKKEYDNIKVKLPFGGFFKDYENIKNKDETPPLTYPYEEMDMFFKASSLLWIKDGISAQKQEEFDIRYDMLTNRIVYPWINECGELCGIMGRLNKEQVDKSERKYMSIIPMNKAKLLFGMYQNYKHILNKGIVFVAESEKSVMKSDLPVVAVGKHFIAPRQVQLLKSMFVDIVIAFDNDVSLEICINEAKKCIVQNPFFKNNVYVLYDKEGKYLKDKQAPFDLDENTLEEFISNCLIKIEEEVTLSTTT